MLCYFLCVIKISLVDQLAHKLKCEVLKGPTVLLHDITVPLLGTVHQPRYMRPCVRLIEIEAVIVASVAQSVPRDGNRVSIGCLGYVCVGCVS